jgi:RHS repeat-associated protein
MWGEAYSYDGFGNLTAKTVTQAPAPALGVSYDANNHQLGLTYDANGNQLWDAQHATAYGWNMENKLVTETSQGWPGAETWYSYDPFGWRVMKDVNADPNGENGGLGHTGGSWEFYFYGITGQKLMTTVCTYYSDGELNCGGGSSYLYFGSRLIQANGSLVVTDRLGSVRAKGVGGAWTQMSYFPYGEERTTTPDGTEKFGTYYRDGVGQDYAEQRYYNNGTGRFWSVDPGGIKTAKPGNPISWNRYLYVNGDPVNRRDPRGLYEVIVGEGMCIVGEGEYQEWTECDYSEGGFFSPTDPGEDAGEGGGGNGPFNPLTIQGFIQAEALALSALATPDCAALFGLAPNSMDPAALLANGVAAAAAGAVSALQFGTTTAQGIAADAAMAGTTVATSDPWAYVNANGQAVESTRVIIEINMAVWTNLTPIQQAQDLIHELGHTFDELLGAGGSAFLYDALPNGQPNPSAEAMNAALVQKCIQN